MYTGKTLRKYNRRHTRARVIMYTRAIYIYIYIYIYVYTLMHAYER